MIHLILQVFCAIFSGVLQGLSIANELLPSGSPFIALFCLVPVYLALYKSRNYREAFWIFFLQALTVHLISSFWLANFKGFAIFTLGASALGTAAEAGLCGVIAFLYPSTRNPSKSLQEEGGRRIHDTSARALWFAASWVVWEWCKSNGFLGYPWGTLSVAAYRWVIFNQIADMTGVLGISFLYALFNAIVGEGCSILSRLHHAQNPSNMAFSYRRTTILTLMLFAVSGAYGLFQYFMPRLPEKILHAVLVQQNIDPWEGGEAKSIRISKELTEKALIPEQPEIDPDEPAQEEDYTVEVIRPDIIVWSEGILNHSMPTSIKYYKEHPDGESLSDFVARMETPLIIGGQTVGDRIRRHYENSAIFYDAKGNYAGFYSKMHLVPFAEKIPFIDKPMMKAMFRRLVGFSNGWHQGSQAVTFTIPLKEMEYAATAPLEYRPGSTYDIRLDSTGVVPQSTADYFTKTDLPYPYSYVTVSVPICFEDAFNDVCSKLYKAGSEVFINITNDSWSKTNSAEIQHFIVASYRAIEYRTTLVRCCNSGYTAVVGPNGKTLQDLPLFQEASLLAEVPIYSRVQTIYSICGDWFPITIMILVALYALYLFFEIHPLPKRTKRHFITISFHTEYLTEDKEEIPTDSLTDDGAPKKAPSEGKEPGNTDVSKDTKPRRKVTQKSSVTSDVKKKTTAAEKKTTAGKKKTSAAEKKTTAAEKKTTAAEKKTTAAEKKTTAAEKKTKASETKKATRSTSKTKTATKKSAGTKAKDEPVQKDAGKAAKARKASTKPRK